MLVHDKLLQYYVHQGQAQMHHNNWDDIFPGYPADHYRCRWLHMIQAYIHIVLFQ